MNDDDYKAGLEALRIEQIRQNSTSALDFLIQYYGMEEEFIVIMEDKT